MELQTVADHVGDLPYMTLKKAERLRTILRKYGCSQLLELGFFHGVSSMYMAAMLDEMGGGTLTTIDKVIAKDKSPNIEELANELGLAGYVQPIFEERTYLWRLMKFIEEGRKFDFCYLDGGHNWSDTGFAFYLVDQLLVDGGLILFDDFNWTAEGKPWAAKMPIEEQKTSPVERTWELLVGNHPRYKRLWVKGGWALARKKRKLPLLPIRY
ncbi:MAG: class I SAM-dependent methyltransferase [Kordiimonadaceae bacterium]|nr:class I SAM-dependent methyltransferase [Kordiimonadaceae bacterium]MBO6567097.1 class I SAM-dependent methyltransferase [Kordiimonadaceae bacterium]MBO6963688.1 class I SAM-dependent methyltransferase [Kordiimonadaceae bacterium]